MSVTVRLALRDPPLAGLKVTLIVQFEPAATDAATQPLVSVKSPALAPEMATLLTVKGQEPVFDTITLWTALVFSN